MRRASVTRIGSCTAGILLLAALAHAGPLDAGTRVCLHAPSLPIENASTDPRTAALQTRLIAALESAGFQVTPPSAADLVVERVAKTADGAIDPYTGRRDPARSAARRALIAKALESELQCQVRMIAEVRPVYAHFQDDAAYWDGTTEHVLSGGRVVMNGIGGVTEWGFVPALSLWLRVIDLEGEELAFRSAGIETLVNFGVVKERDLLPSDRWLKDEAKIAAAIQSALGDRGSLLRGAGHPEPAPPFP
jgi:hypothetical protein